MLMCAIYRLIDTKFCIQVCLGGRYFRPKSGFSVFFSIFCPILDFETIAFIGVYVLRFCVVGEFFYDRSY